MRNLAVAKRARGAIETKIRNVMLAAGIETAADFDAEILHGLVHGDRLGGESRSNSARKTARRSDPKFAGIRAGARGDVDNRSGAWVAESDPLEFTIHIRQIGFTHPPQN